MARGGRIDLWRYWGYIVFGVIVLAVVNRSFGPATYLVLTGVLIFYVLFQAPVWCGAVNRRQHGPDIEYCRRNAYGLLLGCSYRQHKWQKLKSIWWMTRWRQATRGLWSGPPAILATLTGIVGTVTGVVGIIRS